MRLAVFQRGVRDVYQVDGTLMLGGDWNSVAPDGGGIWHGRFYDHGTSYEFRVVEGSLPTYADGFLVEDPVLLYPSMEVSFGAVRILIDYDAPLPDCPSLTEPERALLQRVAAGDDDAATVLADHWGDARGAFVTAQRAGHEVEPDPAWLASIRIAGFAGACVRGFAIPLALDMGEALIMDPDAQRISPRRYLVDTAIGRTGVWQATAAGPNGELGSFAIKVGNDPAIANAGSMLARLDHPNIVRFVGPVEHRRGFGFAMEWAGASIAAQGVLGDERAIAVGLQLCEALRALAKANIVHQRISADCVLIDGDRVRLGGFGKASGPRGRFTTALDLQGLAALLVVLATGNPVPPARRLFGDPPLYRLLRRTLADEQVPSLDDFASSLADASSRAGSSSRP